MIGISQNHNGTSGQTFNNGSMTGNSAYGVFGFDRATDTSGYNIGVYGVTTYGIGAEGLGQGINSLGLFGETDSPSTSVTAATSGYGVIGYDGSSDGGLGDVGVGAFSNGTALLVLHSAKRTPLRPSTPLRAERLNSFARWSSVYGHGTLRSCGADDNNRGQIYPGGVGTFTITAERVLVQPLQK